MKIITRILLVILLGFSVMGCNLEENPRGVFQADNGLRSVDDMSTFRNSFYTYAIAMMAPSTVIYADMGVEYMDPLVSFNNSHVSAQRWSSAANQSEFVYLWLYAYQVISHVNFFFANYDKVYDEIPESDTVSRSFMERIKGEAYIFRATAEYLLLKFYAGNYNEATADTDLGIIISREYNPNVVNLRSSMRECYARLLEDIEASKPLLADYDTVYRTSEGRITYDYITALEAKVYLQKGDYDNAFIAAQSLHDGGRYTLANTNAGMTDLWVNDTSSELIFSFFANANEGGVSYDPVAFCEQTNGAFRVNYIPSNWILNMFPSNDIRRIAYFRQETVPVNQLRPTVFLFIKYEGNPALRVTSGVPNYLNSVKAHRYAEILLIGAEAAVNKSTPDIAAANTYLGEIRNARLTGSTYTPFPEGQIMAEIKTERIKELMMEGGNRFIDLRRWNESMIRSSTNAQTGSGGVTIVHPTLTNITINAGDTRFVWPIPQAEKDGNPGVQQNPGW